MSMKCFSRFCAIGCVLVFVLSGSLSRGQEFTVENTKIKDEFSAKTFSQSWADSTSYYLREPSGESCDGSNILRIGALEGTREVFLRACALVPPGKEKALSVDSFELCDSNSLVLLFANTKRVWRKNTRGDYWIYDRNSGRLHQLGSGFPESSLMFAKMSPDAAKVAYVHEHNLYVEDVSSGEITPLTREGGERFINGTFDWVYEEEFGLYDGFRWSPDGKMIAFWKLDTENVPMHTIINNVDSFYPTLTRFHYPRVGCTNPGAQIGVIRVDRPGEENAAWIPIPGDPRDHYLVSLDWFPGENALLVRQLNRPQNTMSFFLVAENPDFKTNAEREKSNLFGEDFSKKAFQNPEVIHVETDSAWIDLSDLHWFPGENRFVFASEKNGWNHLYEWEYEAGKTTLSPITRGQFDVIDFVAFSRAEGEEQKPDGVYFYASENNATQKYLYHASLDSGKVRRITPRESSGTHLYTISPGGNLAFHTYSSMEHPPVSELVRLPSHESVRVFEDNSELREKLSHYPLGKTEFLTLEIPANSGDPEKGGDLVSIDAWCIYPTNFDPAKKHPVLVYVYGEPAGQTVLDRWDNRYYTWFQMFAQKGYFVVSFDNRGTPAPKGSAWRKSAYRKIGTRGPADQAAALRKFLNDRDYLDPERVGIWGWSGGGSMSLHAIFQYPELYKTAVAVAPVPDERYYDTIYQERYMGLIETAAEDYRNSSPITYASNLRGNLLIVHGTGDDNTHYQTVELLFNELIRHQKQFSMMIYPSRTHGISEGEGTRAHLWTLITNYILEKL